MNFFFFIRRRARVPKDEAVRIARSYVESKGWPWGDPIRVKRRFSTYEIRSNATMRGGNSVLEVDVRTGSVSNARVLPM